LPEATRVAAEIKDAFNIETELIAGGGGVFIVKRDGNIVYDKAETGVFPAESVIIDILKR
jgi:predicted Rdx family selenoprotein